MTRTAIPFAPYRWRNPTCRTRKSTTPRRSIGAHARAVLDENELPALADIHLRLERHGDAVRARPIAQRHLFHAPLADASQNVALIVAQRQVIDDEIGHGAASCLSMIFSENRCTPRIKSGAGFFGIML
jgi:hypothetical protein